MSSTLFSLAFLSSQFFSYIWFRHPSYLLVFLAFCVSCLPLSSFPCRLLFYRKICFQFLSLPRGICLRFLFSSVLFVLFIIFSHHFFYVSLPPMHFKQYFFSALEVCSKLSEFSELTHFYSFYPYICMLCVTLPLIPCPYQVQCLCIQLMFLLYSHKIRPVISNTFNHKL